MTDLEDTFKIRIIASTKPGFEISNKEALSFAALNAGVCYLPDTFEALENEPIQRREKRKKQTLSGGHHSVYDHVSFNLLLEGLPKIMAMVLNNGGVYVTSEKSARFTRMQPTQQEKELYDKWMPIFQRKIEKKYQGIDDAKRIKLAQENARYLTSVFTLTTITHTISHRQLNFFMHWFKRFIESEPNTPFNTKLKPAMRQFNQQLAHLYVEDLDPQVKIRDLSLFARRSEFQEFFGEVYCTTYKGSFAQLAQAHRHRTIRYQMQPITDVPTEFFIPPIIEDDSSLVRDWNNDLASVGAGFPQGALVTITERGTPEDFISKCAERLCGQAQLEVMQQTKRTLDSYLVATETGNPKVHQEVYKYSHGPRCTFPDYNCPAKCIFQRASLERLI